MRKWPTNVSQEMGSVRLVRVCRSTSDLCWLCNNRPAGGPASSRILMPAPVDQRPPARITNPDPRGGSSPGLHSSAGSGNSLRRRHASTRSEVTSIVTTAYSIRPWPRHRHDHVQVRANRTADSEGQSSMECGPVWNHIAAEVVAVPLERELAHMVGRRCQPGFEYSATVCRTALVTSPVEARISCALPLASRLPPRCVLPAYLRPFRFPTAGDFQLP